MALRSYNLSVPGSLMFMGEHAVLQAKPALVCALDKKLFCQLTPRSDQKIIIQSDLGTLKTSIQDFEIHTPFEYVGAAIRSQLSGLKTGFDLNIEMNFSSTVGFGSSAAVSVGICAVLGWWLTGQPLSSDLLFQQARSVVRSVQGAGSGADIAASITGGVVFFQPKPALFRKIKNDLPILCCYSGQKVKTQVVIEQVNQQRAQSPALFRKLDDLIESCVLKAVQAIEQENFNQLGQVMNLHHGLQNAMGVSHLKLEELVVLLRAQTGIFGAKISGAGLGDCVIGLGKCENNLTGQINVAVSEQGILYDA